MEDQLMINVIYGFMRKISLILYLFSVILFGTEIISANEENDASKFCLVNRTEIVSVCYDSNDFPVVKKAAELFAGDVYNVTGLKPEVCNNIRGRNVIIIGTIQNSIFIKDLVDKGKIDISPINGSWERFLMKT